MATTHDSDPELTLAKIGGKWKIPILWRLGQRKIWRYSELKKGLGAISHKMLSRQLRELEDDGIVLRMVYATIPPKVEYSLTNKGRATLPVIDALCDMNEVLDPDVACVCAKCAALQQPLK